MTPSPMLLLFSHVFYGISNILFLVLSALSALVVRKSRWRIHLRWLVPFVIDGILNVLYRTLVNIHYFFGVHYNQAAESMIETTLYMANIVGLYGMFKLLQTLKEMVREPKSVEVIESPQAGVWPPPPTRAS